MYAPRVVTQDASSQSLPLTAFALSLLRRQVVEFEDNTSVRCDNIIYATGAPQTLKSLLTAHAPKQHRTRTRFMRVPHTHERYTLGRPMGACA